MEGDKTQARDRYIVTGYKNDTAILQKLSGRLFASKKYEVPLTHIILVGDRNLDDCRHHDWDLKHSSQNDPHSDSDSDSFVPEAPQLPAAEEALPPIHGDDRHNAEPAVPPNVNNQDLQLNDDILVALPLEQDNVEQVGRRRTTRVPRPPVWHADYEFGDD